MADGDPIFKPRAMNSFFSDWCVDVFWPGGHRETVHGFKNEAHAKGWIEHESSAWIEKVRGPRR